ncbi:MAG: DEAD/DEAH box helicase family protein, partial [Rhabdochlamydiaceae bacterium]
MQPSPSKIRPSKTGGKETVGDSVNRAAKVLEAVGCFETYFTQPFGRHFLEGQQEAIESIDKAFRSGKRFVLVDAPTGSGKSYLGMTFALQTRDRGRCHILTPQKILQDQYALEEAFSPYVYVMKGKGSYTCQRPEIDPLGNEIKLSCAEGECNR